MQKQQEDLSGNINLAKDKIQVQAISLFQQHKSILLSWATGCSKSLAAIRCINSFNYIPKVLLIVGEELHKENWREEYSKWEFDYLLSNTTIECYASLKNYQDTEFDIIILDEAHHISELKENYLKTIKAKKIILLSATINQAVKNRIKNFVDFYEYDISLSEGIDLGILPPPSVYLIAVKLDDNTRKNSTFFGKKKVWLSDKKLANKLDGEIKHWQNRKEEVEMEALAQHKDIPNTEWIDRKILMIGNERKKFLAECKTKAAKELLTKLEGKRGIWFCGSVEQADALSKEYSVHSYKHKKKNAEIIALFNAFAINTLFLNKMGREGMNFAGIEYGVIVQLDSGRDEGLSFFQKSGRAMRSNDPSIYILYCKDTKDEQYMEEAIKHIDKQYIKKL